MQGSVSLPKRKPTLHLTFLLTQRSSAETLPCALPSSPAPSPLRKERRNFLNAMLWTCSVAPALFLFQLCT